MAAGIDDDGSVYHYKGLFELNKLYTGTGDLQGWDDLVGNEAERTEYLCTSTEWIATIFPRIHIPKMGTLFVRELFSEDYKVLGFCWCLTPKLFKRDTIELYDLDRQEYIHVTFKNVNRETNTMEIVFSVSSKIVSHVTL